MSRTAPTPTSRDRLFRRVRIGGATKTELLSRLNNAHVQLNSSARALFADERFTTSAVASVVETVEISVRSLGFADGATLGQIVEQAAGAKLSPCPLELGPHLRLQYTDQPEGSAGQPSTEHRAPPGAITVASLPLDEDDDTPKGFYLRRVDGVLWLRGYRSWSGHIWSPDDAFVFLQRDAAV